MMVSTILSALFSFAGWLIKSSVVKFFIYFGLFFITTEFIQLILPSLPGAASLRDVFREQSPGVWYFFDLFKIGFGVSSSLGAYVTRFIIRRIPVIG